MIDCSVYVLLLTQFYKMNMMVRKTGDRYYENVNGDLQDNIQPPVKTSSSEFQILFIHYDNSYNNNLQNAYPLRRRYSISKDEKI